MTNEQIENLFTYHAPMGNQQERYVAIRDKAKQLALLIQTACPESREKSLAITSLQQTVTWANASIAVNETLGLGGGFRPITESAKAMAEKEQ